MRYSAAKTAFRIRHVAACALLHAKPTLSNSFMTASSIFENVFAWAMIAGGLTILFGVRWRPTKLWQSPKRRGRKG